MSSTAEQPTQAQDAGQAADAEAGLELIDLPQGIKKRIIQQGQGEEGPDDGCEVSVHYTGTFEDGKEFDSSISRGSPFNFTLGAGSVIKGWEIAVKTMKRHEIAEFTLPPDVAYGSRGAPPTIPPNTTLKFVIELKDWTSGESDDMPMHRLSAKERLDKCNEVKMTGGSHFKEGKYDQAIEEYRKVVRYAVSSTFKDNGEVVDLDDSPNSENFPAESPAEEAQRQELKQMLLVGHLNLALCYLKLNKTKDCISSCDEALEIEPNNVKALFRKGLAYLQTNDYELALKQFEKLLEIDPNNAEAKIRKNACNVALRNYYQKQKDIYKNLFSK